jgi:hypothetical protein
MAQESGLTKAKDELKDESSRAMSTTATTTAVDKEINGADDPEQIRAEIDETRSEMGETINEIQERLSVANITEQVSEQVNSAIDTVKSTAYDATVGKAVNFMKQAGNEIGHTSVGRTIMQNPIPFALIGAGTAMLLMNLRNKDTYRTSYPGRSGGRTALTGAAGYRASDTSYSGSSEGVVDKAKHTYENAVDSAKHKYEDAYDSVSGAASSAYEKVAEVADSTYSGAVGLVSKAKDRAGDLGHTVQENYEYYAEEKPLALAAAAVAVGAAIGFALPSSRYESEMMGEARDNLFEKAEATAGQLVDQAKATATNAGKAATEELGLTGETGSQTNSGTSSTGTKGSSTRSTQSTKNPSTR